MIELKDGNKERSNPCLAVVKSENLELKVNNERKLNE